jgi:hypothetical protein
MSKIALNAGVATVLVFSGMALPDKASGQEQQYRRMQQYQYQQEAQVPLGDGGAHWGGRCWIATNGSSNSLYLGYWGDCPRPKR